MKIKVRVKPKSSKRKIEKISNEEYKVYLKSAPEKGKANIELIKLLKKEFRGDIKIIKGKTSRNKIVEIVIR